MPPLYNRRSDSGLPASAGRPLVALPLGELLTRVRQALSERFAESYWVVAEIADLTLPRYDGAHCYLVLTDQHTTGRGAELKAQARATIWSQRYQQLAPVFCRAHRPGVAGRAQGDAARAGEVSRAVRPFAGCGSP
ncbi:exodeoxyribonuclease VII large subunit [Hymenobacter sp. NBH84]|uniref:exodeoxyribonuclease VII large subunit n=1 Tax=Hymenobacter sp. NBH84 TaxID=2596915 RepID=UPI001626DBBA|nr:exodeoxyribonuclease VII large subunit [Hymenobacter sp. NBH84]